jgi:hypothetical protein
MAEKKKWSPLDGDRPKPGTPEGEEYETRHITPGPERERELARRKKKREQKSAEGEDTSRLKANFPQPHGIKGESTNNKFDSRLEAVYKSLMSEDATDTAAETMEKQAAAVAGAHAKKGLARKAMDALTGSPDGDIADKYDELQTKKKTKLLPALKDAIDALDAQD